MSAPGTIDLTDYPHRRFNLLTAEWVLVSPHRTQRPWHRRSVENGDAPFPAGREAVRMFLRGFPVFPSWLSAQIVSGNVAARSEICRRFGGGSAGKSALLGNGRQ